VNTKKNILIIGPFGKRGGRELEAAFIAQSLSVKFEVTLFSTVNIQEESDLYTLQFKGRSNGLNKYLYQTNFLVKLLTDISFLFRKKKRANYFHISNGLTRRFLSLEKLKGKALEKIVRNFDLVIVCSQLHSKYIPAVVDHAKKQNIPVLFRTTGTIHVEQLDGSADGWLSKVTRFIHHSESNALRLSTFHDYPYCIIDQCAFNEAALLELPLLNKEIKKFLCIGRLDANKNIESVINAFLKTTNATFMLTIAGNGLEENKLKKLAANDPRIRFVGHIDNNELHGLYAAVDCLIIASHEESGPITALEAMAAGCLILSTDVGAMKDRLIDYPFWFDGSVADLHHQMTEILLLSSEDVFEYSRMLRNSYVSNYTKDKIAAAYINLTSSLVS